MKRTRTHLSLTFIAFVVGALLAPTPAAAGPLCEAAPPPVCVSAFDLCKGVTPDACGPCEEAGIIEICVKCVEAGDDCDPAEVVCDLVVEACKGAGDYDQDCDAQRADCEDLFP